MGASRCCARRPGIATREWSYPQVALTALLSHDRPHREVSTEFHTRQGPFTLVPLPGKPGAPHRSSLVWMMDPREARRRQTMDDAHLAREMNEQSHFLLGRAEAGGPARRFPDERARRRDFRGAPHRAGWRRRAWLSADWRAGPEPRPARCRASRGQPDAGRRPGRRRSARALSGVARVGCALARCGRRHAQSLAALRLPARSMRCAASGCSRSPISGRCAR